MQGKPSCQTDGSEIRDCGLQEIPDRLVEREDVVVTDEEMTDAEPSTVSTYLNESGELYTEDFDQHMAILPKVVTSAAKISLKTFK